MTYLNLLLQLALEATPDDLALTGLQSVRDRRNGTDVIRHREQDELLVDEVRDRDLVDIVVQEGAGLEKSSATDPCIDERCIPCKSGATPYGRPPSSC